MEPLVEGPPHMTSPDGVLEVWFVEPLGIVDVHKGGHFAEPQAIFLTQDVSKVLERLARERQCKASFIHDWNKISSYDVATRTRIIQWGLKWGRANVENIWVILGPETPTFVRMACSMGSLAMNVAGIKLEINDDQQSARSGHARKRLAL